LLVHVVSHTHWDREWYHTAERFRQRLVPLVDELLDDAAGGSFLLDGQTVVLEDYLSVRPERASELSAALRSGRLEAGPWFVLADELIPGGEGLIRNLLAGARTMRDMRAESPPVLYCPDSFGHPAALPDIAAGFGKALIVVWRGCRSERDSFHWHGRHERVIAYHLSRSGYELGANLPTDADAAPARWSRINGELADRSATGLVLLLNGADHHARQLDLDKAIKELGWVGKPATIEAAGLAQFARELTRRAASSKLGEVAGELRDSYGYTWTLQGTLASRAHQKRRYARIERELVRDVEPWATIARLTRGASRQHLTRAAWRDVLLCQPHDTLCGCSIDAVARAMDARMESAEQQAAGIREDSLFDIVGHDRSVARSSSDQQQAVLVVRNPSARVRSGVATVWLDTKLADAPVGPGSRPHSMPKSFKSLWPANTEVQGFDPSLVFSRAEAPRAYPDNDRVLRRPAAAWVNDVPAFGVCGLPMSASTVSPPLPVEPVSVSRNQITNGILALSWTKTGQVSLKDVATGRTVRGLLTWESKEDLGDLYTPSIRKTKFAGRCVGTRVMHRGPLRGYVGQAWRFAKGKQRIDVRVGLALDAGASFVRIELAGDNRATDHRLRLVIVGDVGGDAVVADAALGPVERSPIRVSADAARMEKPIVTAPLHRYVSRFDAKRGMTLYSDGLAEYEAVKRGFAVTVVRSVGELSRAGLPERPGHAGWPVPTPEAQCQGEFTAAFAVMLHGPKSDDVVNLIERTADDVLFPLTGETLRTSTAAPVATQGVALEGAGLAFSALKESEVGDWTLLRCVNLFNREVSGRWRFGHAIREAKGSRLDELPLEKLAVSGNAVAFRAPPRGVVTILVR
jgi:mannosylglycerate hydrolase